MGMTKMCSYCGKAYEGRPNSKYCGKTCVGLVKRERTAMWSKTNPERAKERHRQRYLEKRDILLAQSRAWREDNREYALSRQKEYDYRRRYGVTMDQVTDMKAAQGGRCAICQRKTRLCLDHNHDTGAVRGLLCNSCNHALGLFRDNKENLVVAVQYIDLHQ